MSTLGWLSLSEAGGTEEGKERRREGAGKKEGRMDGGGKERGKKEEKD